MADRNIVTQVGIEDLKFALAEIAENLDTHINASLSKAHGINILTGYIDANGNDLTTYQDSNGDIIGNYFLRFVVANVIYFAPAIVTSLAGQPATSGVVNTSPDGEFDGQGGSAWITDYTSDQVQQAEAINQDVLIPHTRQPHESTHGSMTVVLQNTFSSLGHTIGTHVIQIKFSNSLYTIPCTTRFGGPDQGPRISGIPTNLSVEIASGDSNDCNVPITVVFNGGTKPVAYHWQFNNTGVWTDITPAAGSVVLPGWDSGVEFQWSDTSNPTFRITQVKPGSGQTRSAQFRCRVTNAGVPNTGPTSGILTNVCTFTATDNTGGCFITTAVCIATGLGDDCDDLCTLRAFRDSYVLPTHSGQALLKEYSELGPKIATALLSLPNYKAVCTELYATHISTAVHFIKSGNQGAALGEYVQMVRQLQRRFNL
jgi:hypothetical protein